MKPAVLPRLTSSDRLDLAEGAPSAGIAACLNQAIQQNELLEVSR